MGLIDEAGKIRSVDDEDAKDSGGYDKGLSPTKTPVASLPLPTPPPSPSIPSTSDELDNFLDSLAPELSFGNGLSDPGKMSILKPKAGFKEALKDSSDWHPRLR